MFILQCSSAHLHSAQQKFRFGKFLLEFPLTMFRIKALVAKQVFPSIFHIASNRAKIITKIVSDYFIIPDIYTMGAFHTQVTTQTVKLTLLVGG